MNYSQITLAVNLLFNNYNHITAYFIVVYTVSCVAETLYPSPLHAAHLVTCLFSPPALNSTTGC